MVYEQIIGPILQLLDTIFIYINSLVYDFINFLYQIFIAIAGAQLFTSDQYQEIANRIYIIIGVVSLFLISYVLLRAIVNPDGSAKSEYSVQKIIPNIIKVILFIGLVPVIFSMAYRIQDIIVNTNVIPKIIFGSDKFVTQKTDTGEYSYASNGRTLANGIFTGFMYPKDDVDASEIEISSCYFPAPNCDGIGEAHAGDAAYTITRVATWGLPFGFFWGKNTAEAAESAVDRLTEHFNGGDSAYTFEMAELEVNAGTKNFQVYANFGSKMHGEEKQLEYNGIFQLIAGIIVIYVFINYCIDLGVRAIKLGYYQLIAPICIMTILSPGQSKVFNNWLKSSISTFIDVFLRIAIIFLGLLAIDYLPSVGDEIWARSGFAENVVVQNFARVFLIIGILIFVKQAPKLLSDLFGIQGGAFKLGIKDKLGEMAGIGGAVKKGLERAESATVGGTTGALGGAYGAWRNKGSIKKGAFTGFWTGFKGSGNQFGKQMQNIYSQGGGKGVAGAFGGQKWSDRMSDRYKDQYKDDYQDRILSARVNKETNFADPKSKIYPYYTDQFADLSAQKQREIDIAQQESIKAEKDVKDRKTKFEADKAQKLENIRSVMSNINAANSKQLVQGFEQFEANKAAMKASIDTAQTANVEALNNEKVKFESNQKAKINDIKTEMAQKQMEFNTNKKQQLDSLNAELQQMRSLGNTSRVQELENKISTLNTSQFDTMPFDNQIRSIQNTKFEDTNEYNQLKIKQDNEIKVMQQEYNEKYGKTYEQTDEYAKLITKANAQEQQLYKSYVQEYNSKVEDNDEYKKSFKTYEEIKNKYNQAYADLNNGTEQIIKNVFDEKKGKLVSKVYNPNYESNNFPMYIDLNELKDYSEEDKKKILVSSVQKQAFENAVKDLKDKDETYKNDDTKFASRVKNKDDAEWLKTDEGRHMSMIVGNYFDKKSDKPDGDKK